MSTYKVVVFVGGENYLLVLLAFRAPSHDITMWIFSPSFGVGFATEYPIYSSLYAGEGF